MPTPSKYDLQASRFAGAIVKVTRELEEKFNEQMIALSKAAETGLIPVNAKSRDVKKRINELLALAGGIQKVYAHSTPSIQMELELGMSHGVGLADKNNITIDTDLLNEAPRLCAKFGYKHAKEMLNRAFVNRSLRIDGYRFCQCFGFSGTECHFVDFFRDWAKEMHGILVHGVPFKGYVYSDCGNFMDTYYKKYYLKQAKGIYVARTSKGDKYVFDRETKQRV